MSSLHHFWFLLSCRTPHIGLQKLENILMRQLQRQISDDTPSQTSCTNRAKNTKNPSCRNSSQRCHPGPGLTSSWMKSAHLPTREVTPEQSSACLPTSSLELAQDSHASNILSLSTASQEILNTSNCVRLALTSGKNHPGLSGLSTLLMWQVMGSV